MGIANENGKRWLGDFAFSCIIWPTDEDLCRYGVSGAEEQDSNAFGVAGHLKGMIRDTTGYLMNGREREYNVCN